MTERESKEAGLRAQGAADEAPAVRLRDQHGAVTKRVILRAARRRFAEHGYAGTSVKDIAKEAGIAVQTLYSALGSKSGVLLGLLDLVDEEAGVFPLFEAMATVEEPADALPLFARIRRQIRQECGDIIAVLRAGARVDAEIGAAWAEGMRRRHAGIARIVSRLADTGALRTGLDPGRATDILAAVVTDDVCDVLVDQRGWTFDDYEHWLAQTMAQLVLEPQRPTKHRR